MDLLLERFIEFQVQNTSTSIGRYDHILEQLESEKCAFRHRQIFDYAKINTNKSS